MMFRGADVASRQLAEIITSPVIRITRPTVSVNLKSRGENSIFKWLVFSVIGKPQMVLPRFGFVDKSQNQRAGNPA